MVKATGIRQEELLSVLKALFPVFAGIVFFGVIIYIFSVYRYHNRLDSYFVLNENRTLLQQRYSESLGQLNENIGELKGSNNDKKLKILDQASELNIGSMDLVNQMIVDSYEILDLGIVESEPLDLAINELNYLRMQLHIKVETLIERQTFAIKYIKQKDSTESCYNKINLGSQNYSGVVSQLNKCSEKLTAQSEFIENGNLEQSDFTKTKEYLNKYETYWALVRQMYSLLVREKTDQAKNVSADVKKQLKSLSTYQKAAENELNTLLLEDIKSEIAQTQEDIAKKIVEIEGLEDSTSF
jgi:hypothetical protein